jgi:hypothetical protein
MSFSGVPTGLARLSARFPRPRFVDREGAASDVRTVESVNHAMCRAAVRHLDEAKASRAANLTVSHDPDCIYRSIRLEELAQVLLRGGKGEVAHKDIHVRILRGKGVHCRQALCTLCQPQTDGETRRRIIQRLMERACQGASAVCGGRVLGPRASSPWSSTTRETARFAYLTAGAP